MGYVFFCYAYEFTLFACNCLGICFDTIDSKFPLNPFFLIYLFIQINRRVYLNVVSYRTMIPKSQCHDAPPPLCPCQPKGRHSAPGSGRRPSGPSVRTSCTSTLTQAPGSAPTRNSIRIRPTSGARGFPNESVKPPPGPPASCFSPTGSLIASAKGVWKPVAPSNGCCDPHSRRLRAPFVGTQHGRKNNTQQTLASPPPSPDSPADPNLLCVSRQTLGSRRGSETRGRSGVGGSKMGRRWELGVGSIVWLSGRECMGAKGGGVDKMGAEERGQDQGPLVIMHAD